MGSQLTRDIALLDEVVSSVASFSSLRRIDISRRDGPFVVELINDWHFPKRGTEKLVLKVIQS